MTMRNLMISIVGLAACLGGCSPDLCDSGECETRVVVARNISFAMEEGDGVAEGFDLDGRVSEGVDLQSCNQPDYVAPDGRTGIDNQFAVLWEAIVDVIGDAVDGLLVGAINDGNLLFMAEMRGLDDPRNDECVEVNIFLGTGQPLVGTDGLIVPGQTFDVGEEGNLSHIECGVVKDGILTAGPFDGEIPIHILDVQFNLRVHDAMIRGELRDDGSMSAIIGAAVDGQQIIDVAEQNDYRLEGLVGTLVRNRSDMGRDEFGDCQRLSATMIYDGISAYTFEDAQR
jgi:hypothetical protein